MNELEGERDVNSSDPAHGKGSVKVRTSSRGEVGKSAFMEMPASQSQTEAVKSDSGAAGGVFCPKMSSIVICAFLSHCRRGMAPAPSLPIH